MKGMQISTRKEAFVNLSNGDFGFAAVSNSL